MSLDPLHLLVRILARKGLETFSIAKQHIHPLLLPTERPSTMSAGEPNVDEVSYHIFIGETLDLR